MEIQTYSEDDLELSEEEIFQMESNKDMSETREHSSQSVDRNSDYYWYSIDCHF